jgi:chromosome segregation protein
MEMKGFKSFATKTEVLFDDGTQPHRNKFNCILGPNGSGKSNVLDALCFVLGKAGAKGLRVEKSSNLIYNGGKSKKPAKEGEVSIWFDNKKRVFSALDDDEIKITRIIKATGQGVYKVNDKTTTRTAVVDLLAMANINPDGYNIILQGDIVRLIEMSPTERRQIIEEIAGINVYEDKKQKAMRELTRVEEKLNEADIILAERETYLKELKKDRDKAQKYKDLEEKRKRNKKTLILDAIHTREEQSAKLQADMHANNDKISKLEQDIELLRKDIASKKEAIHHINKEVEEKGEKEQVKMHKLVEELKVNVAVNKQRLQTIDTEIEKIALRQQELQSSQKELSEKTKDIDKRKTELEKQIFNREKDKAHIEEKISIFKKKHNLEQETDADSKINDLDKELESIQEELNLLREEQQNKFREKDKVDMQLQSIDQRLEKLASVQAEHKKELELLKSKKQEFKKATVELSKTLSLSSEYASQLATARSKLLSRQEDLAKLEARRASILESVAGSSAIKAILELRKKEPGIHGTVAELGTVKKDYGLALEVAGGNKIKAIVVEDDAVAAKCIRHLKEKRLGVATFLPLNKIRGAEIDSRLQNMKTPGIKGLAINLITFKSRYEKIFSYVFGNTLVVDSIDTARRVGIGKLRMVTMTGDVTETSGAMQGGFRQAKEQGLFGQEEVNKQIELLEQQVADEQHVISLLEQKSYDNEELITRLRNLKGELEGEIIKTEKMLHLDGDDSLLDSDAKKQLQQQSKAIDKNIDEVQDAISQKNKHFASLKIQRQQLRDKLMDLRNPTKLAELKTFEEKRMELQQEIIQLRGDIKHLAAEAETIIGPEERKIIEIIKQHEKELAGFKIEKQKLLATIKEEETDLKAKEKQEAAFYAQFRELFTQRSKLTDAVSKSENAIATHNNTQRSFELKNNALGLELARVKAELSGYHEEDKDYQDVEAYTSKSKDVIKRELSEFDRLTADLGAVNMRALEIYEQVETEYHSLQSKKETLRGEREDVLVMMNEIDSKKKELFMKTFEALQENFQRIFSTLLMKGEASIVLEDKNDPFAGGVEIKVRLTGTRFLDIRSLSGGEKTLTALAFLFAVQEYEPASFYVLDEVDAALDKKNSQKLAELVRGYCEHAQYIVISHNDGVISEADTLYGVSMNEHGMSKITSLKI